MILPTIQGAAPLKFLWHQIIGDLQTRYHVFPHSMTHISYNTDPLKYLFIYLPADRHLGWVRVELDKPWLEKKIIRDISHFWRISARWKICRWECFLMKVCFLPYLHTGQSVSLVGVVTNPLCPSEPSSHLQKEGVCFVPSLSPHLYQTPISEGSCSKRAPLLQTYFA